MNKIVFRELLRDDIDFDTAKKIQEKYQHLSVNMWQNHIDLKKENCKIVVGTDVHYYKKGVKEFGIACAVFWDVDKEEIIDCSFSEMEIKFPYKAGYLGFREAKIISQAIKYSKIKADLLMCDGHGIIHPRNFGEAVHLGLTLNISSLGIAKNPFIGFSNWKNLKKIKGSKTPIWFSDPKVQPSNNRILGYAICLANSKKPVFLSIGFKISLEDAIEIALKTSIDHKQPEPLFFADKYAREFNQ